MIYYLKEGVKMVTKNGEVYLITVSIEEGDLDLSEDISLEGDFTVEMFEKDFGSAVEDTRWVDSITAEDLFINNKGCSWEKVNPRIKNKLISYVLSNAKDQLHNYLYGS